MFRAARRQQPELWKRWADSGDAVVLPMVVPMMRNGAPAGEVDVVLALDGERAVAALPDGQSAALVPRPANLREDGMRWSWVCPKSGRVCGALLLPPGADGFASRQAHGLRYQAEREGPAERAMRKVRKVRTRLGDIKPAGTAPAAPGSGPGTGRRCSQTPSAGSPRASTRRRSGRPMPVP